MPCLPPIHNLFPLVSWVLDPFRPNLLRCASAFEAWISPTRSAGCSSLTLMGARYPLVFLILLLLHGTKAAPDPPVPGWLTLSGRRPVVVARGGFSGLLPESGQLAYNFAMHSSVCDVVLFCDLQLSSDGVGFCHSSLRLDNSSDIAQSFPNRGSTYQVNGQDVQGWFSLDFKSKELHDIVLSQNILSRPNTFDKEQQLLSLDNVVQSVLAQQGEVHAIWVNIEYNSFFMEHGLSSEGYIVGLPKEFPVTHVSSPEFAFLKGLSGKVRSNIKLIFRFLREDLVEPTTKRTYGELLKDLKSIKAFASGILVPKQFIWPQNKDMYLEPSTSLVKDAHALGLEVYASGFANDDPCMSYNYSYDPSAEILQYIDNSEFSVDGVLTDNPPTASAALVCMAHTKGNPFLFPPVKAGPPPGEGENSTRPLIITHNGASGVFSDSTDLAYQQAVKDGADIIDCWVRMSKDGVAFCLGSTDLNSSTTAATTFLGKMTTVNEIQNKSGIFSFDLLWSEIQTLKPNLIGPFADARLERNPAAKNAGKFVTLPEFLDFAKASNITGILMGIEHATYLIARGLDVVDAVSKALVKSGYDKETCKQRVLIQSEDAPVLTAFKSFPKFQRVLTIEFDIRDASKPSVEEILQFANAVKLRRSSAARVNGFFLEGFTDSLVNRLHAGGLQVYVGVLRNEFMNLAFDYWADPLVEVATDTLSVGADGLVTEFPATAAAFFRSPCSTGQVYMGYTISPAEPGGLLMLAVNGSVPPAPPPAPVLEPQDILQQQLPVCPNEPMFRTFRCRLAPKEKEKATGKPEYNINLASLDG
ncbi:glycerophosphodiester phosphodiesterase GDPDL7-like isoform X1 [Hordeum vulgare subsp. vulgare]|nr:glycerophosphodiester phosphodiesterase GDPDL7-like isoform X1 [Hordeum vulgare subsp. vulgare]XP_044981442.1 glycerophosphodiester phosphodiesterase GDPDL7-like isoform X1 [Hordeum vulgare subsp. vulgare]